MTLHLSFVAQSASQCNNRELLAAVADAAATCGVSVSIDRDVFAEVAEHTVFVVVPEPTTLSALRPSRWQRMRTVALCTKRLGTTDYDRCMSIAGSMGACFDISTASTLELRRRGVNAEHFQLGYFPGWDHFADSPADRRLDVVLLGSGDAREQAVLASQADWLWPWKCQFLLDALSTPEELRAESPGVLPEGGARLLLSIHPADTAGLDWVSCVRSILQGCVVVTEHSSDAGPLVPGQDFVSGDGARLGKLVGQTLEDPSRLESIQLAGYDHVRSIDVEPAIVKLIEAATALKGYPRWVWPTFGRPIAHAVQQDRTSEQIGVANLRVGLKRVAVDSVKVRRRLERVECLLRGDDPDAAPATATDAYRREGVDVSVVIPLFNYRREVIRALTSVLRSDHLAYEVIVVDDASTDGSALEVEGFMKEHDDAPIVLLKAAANHGPGWARNRGIEVARGADVLFLDADNEVFPTTISRLRLALDEHPAAAFTYPMLCYRTSDGKTVLFSHERWSIQLLRERSAIDMFALVRRSALLAVGGFAEDTLFDGFEDYDLWCRLAAHGHSGLLVPEILGIYNKSPNSLLAFADIDHTDVLARIRSRAPGVFSSPSGLENVKPVDARYGLE